MDIYLDLRNCIAPNYDQTGKLDKIAKEIAKRDAAPAKLEAR